MADQTAAPSPASSGPAAAPAAAAPAAAPAASTESAPKESSSSSYGASAPESSAAAADPWSPDSFSWDDWDGSSYDDFPDEVRPLAERFGNWHQSRTQAQKQEQERLQMLYDAMLDGDEDPRISELTGKYDTTTKELEAYRGKYDEARREVEAVIEYVVKAEEQRMKAEADAFESANKWLFTPEYEKTALEMLDAGFDYKLLPELVKLPKSIRDAAKAVFEKTKDSSIAIRVAKAEAGLQRSDAGTAPFVAGSTSPAPKARTSEKPSTSGPLNSDRILAVVRSHMNRKPR
jgi:hypothetical protein